MLFFSSLDQEFVSGLRESTSEQPVMSWLELFTDMMRTLAALITLPWRRNSRALQHDQTQSSAIAAG